jgi:peptidyl-prolyl cis-trans isomerase SurA
MRRSFVLLLLPGLLLAPDPAGAEIVEQVVAKVNGQIITLSEFQSRQIAAAQGARVDPANIGPFLRQNNARILQDAIDEILILQKAQDAGIRAPSQWIDEAIDGIKKDNNIASEEQFQDALEREGLTLGELRQNIERGVLRRIVIQRDIQPKIEAGEAELLAEYEKLKDSQFTKPPTVTLQEILVAEAPGAEALARDVAARARAGEDFSLLAATHSAAPSRAQGGDIGQFSKGELHPELEALAFDLAVGSVSDPLPVEGGYRILKVTAKTSGSTTPFDAAKERVRDRIMMSRFEAAYDAYVEELRKDAVVELRVREVPLQLTGPIPEGSLLEALEPLAPGPGPAGPGPTASPAEPLAPPPADDDEITTTPQAAPERVAPPSPPPGG